MRRLALVLAACAALATWPAWGANGPPFPGIGQPGGVVGVGSDVSPNTVTATGGTTARTGAARAAERVNPMDFGADPTGANDSAPAFQAAIASVPSGSYVRLFVPSLPNGTATYKCGSNVTNNGRHVSVDMMSGALVCSNYGGTGTGVLYVDQVQRRSSNSDAISIDIQGAGSASSVATIGERMSVANNGGNAALGRYYNYTNYNTGAANTNGGDIAFQTVASWPNAVSGITGFVNWWIGVGPLMSATDLTNGNNFSLTSEFNPVNNGPDPGFTEYDSSLTGAGFGVPAYNVVGLTSIPDVWAPTGSYGGNISYAWGCFQSSVINKRPTTSANTHVPTAAAPYNPRSYACLHIGNDSIAPGGRAIYAGGNKDGVVANMPYAFLEARRNWLHGLVTVSATIQDGYAMLMSQSQGIGWTDGTNFAGIGLTGTGATAAPLFKANGGSQAQIGTLAGADIPVILTGGKTGTTNARVSTANGGFDFSASGVLNFLAGGNYVLSGTSTLLKALQPVQLRSFTVATLPTCNTSIQDSMASVSDANAPTYRGALTGGGTVRTPVYCDGTSWTAH